ncbi:MAG: DUF3800 domain-containing protein [Anaerolineae bacterium]|nr:DUF3800 domain-containing protein [Anaerolineae bacterium]
MKTAQAGATWFFVDESGDPTFYDRSGNLIVGQPGCSSILLLGFIETQQPQAMRRAMLDLRREIVNDPYFQEFSSIKKTTVAFHAKDDVAEIRYQVYKLLASLDFKAQFVVARKVERVFRNSFQAKEHEFYDHLVSQLFENMLHRYQTNHIYFAKRGSRNRQMPLARAIERGVQHFEQKWGASVATTITMQAQRPKGEPCLSVIDYMNWAVYRAFTRGEMRYYNAVAEKVSLLVDLYDIAKYPDNWYNRRNPFEVKKITPL